MNTYIVDTHALLWYVSGDKRLSKKAESALDSDNSFLIIPTVVLAELVYLFNKHRVTIPLTKIMNYLRSDPRCTVHPFDLSCVEILPRDLNLHDAMIVSVGLLIRNTLDADTSIITKDKDIRDSRLIKTIW